MASLLEQARARAAARRERQVTITLPELELDLVCDVPTDMAVVERMQSEAKKFDKGQARATHFARALVAAQTREIRISGELVEVDGEVVGFRDPELWPESWACPTRSRRWSNWSAPTVTSSPWRPN